MDKKLKVLLYVTARNTLKFENFRKGRENNPIKSIQFLINDDTNIRVSRTMRHKDILESDLKLYTKKFNKNLETLERNSSIIMEEFLDIFKGIKLGNVKHTNVTKIKDLIYKIDFYKNAVNVELIEELKLSLDNKVQNYIRDYFNIIPRKQVVLSIDINRNAKSFSVTRMNENMKTINERFYDDRGNLIKNVRQFGTYTFDYINNINNKDHNFDYVNIDNKDYTFDYINNNKDLLSKRVFRDKENITEVVYSYEYDEKGNLLNEFSDGDKIFENKYDNKNRIIYCNDIINNIIITYKYIDNYVYIYKNDVPYLKKSKEKSSYIDGNEYIRQYDDNNNLIKVTFDSEETLFEYDELNRLIKVSKDNNVFFEINYDKDNIIIKNV